MSAREALAEMGYTVAQERDGWVQVEHPSWPGWKSGWHRLDFDGLDYLRVLVTIYGNVKVDSDARIRRAVRREALRTELERVERRRAELVAELGEQ
jgi:hypothetical protein